MIKKLVLAGLLFLSYTAQAQDYIPKNDGVKTNTSNYTVLTNAKLFITPTQVVENGTLVIKDGKVVSSGKNVSIPKNSIVIDLAGKSVYPSFIDIYSDFGIDGIPNAGSSNYTPQYDASREGYYWNDHIRPDVNAIDFFKYDASKAEALRKAGFGVVTSHVNDGIIQGSGLLVALTNDEDNSKRILDDHLGLFYGTSKSKTSNQSYPTSLMGAFALLRQVNLDAQWYAKGNMKVKDRALEAFLANKNEVQFFNAGSKNNALRLDKIGDGFNTQYVFLGGGDEFELIENIKNTNANFIIPINFPEAYDMEDPLLARSVSLEDMRMWNQAPSNPKVLSENNVPFALTTYDLKKTETFHTNLMQAIAYGLDKTKALEALTTVPARIIGKSNELGHLKPGAYANFLIMSGEIFDKKTVLYQNWVNGHKSEINAMDITDMRADYALTMDGANYTLKISGEVEKLKAEITTEEDSYDATVKFNDDWLQLVFTTKDSIKQEFIRLVSQVKNPSNFSGKVFYPNGKTSSFNAVKNNSEEQIDVKKEEDKAEETPKIYPVTYPNLAFGPKETPKQQTILFKNATVWTNEQDGVLEQTDVLIKDGKISKIGKNLSAGNAMVVDATGKHITAGIIDEHSHIATTSVNESGHNSTAEVTIEDVVDAEDIDIYRNLAGGVTSIQILHGSANPIGGRSAIIKLKWGQTADQLIYKNSPKFIKFALGENVKQSNWGDFNTTRFPQTRMGVEQVYINYFQRAKEYDALKKSGKPYRKDLELETLAEILNKERFISCHSYVQSEINMLMKVAEQFNFNINTFTHILEGYKVADKMVEHGVGGSTFSDWWAYKFEVNDAIPYNAAIMHNAGVTVAINSDDAEMSRRLNQEAAKSVKYGGISEEEAWKFVTLNPAKLLHLDDRVGSLKVGKDADVVLWSGHPMSIYTKAEKTIIDGAVYFDIETDKQLREEVQKEKNELTTLMLQAKNKGLKTKPIEKKEKELLHCDSIDQH
ncbi:amidohydrolase family protein [Aurantibacter aestuarii]|uniref:Amidohydrolase n=1 Tax=Aurantibacter aestuarii TaxID=1266046 RepID=A0A2T1NAA5_9FLAO|nr:amidohydrolase family protein [Aurantibacter aestuarii]PSG88763.1 amidohydrolase [Aurantibacter aestuarii]